MAIEGQRKSPFDFGPQLQDNEFQSGSVDREIESEQNTTQFEDVEKIKQISEIKSLKKLSAFLVQYDIFSGGSYSFKTEGAIKLIDLIRSEMIKYRDDLVAEDLRGENTTMNKLLENVKALEQYAGSFMGKKVREIIQYQLRDYFENSGKLRDKNQELNINDDEYSRLRRGELATKAINESQSFEQLINIVSKFKYIKESFTDDLKSLTRKERMITGEELRQVLSDVKSEIDNNLSAVYLDKANEGLIASEVEKIMGKYLIPSSHNIKTKAIELIKFELISKKHSSSSQSSQDNKSGNFFNKIKSRFGSWFGSNKK